MVDQTSSFAWSNWIGLIIIGLVFIAEGVTFFIFIACAKRSRKDDKSNASSDYAADSTLLVVWVLVMGAALAAIIKYIVLGIGVQGFKVIEGTTVNWIAWVVLIFIIWFMVAATLAFLLKDRRDQKVKHASVGILAMFGSVAIVLATFSDHQTKWVYFAIAVLIYVIVIFCLWWNGARWPIAF